MKIPARYVVLGMSALLPAALISFYLMPRALPWWTDAGNWLKYMHALFGNIWPMWGINPLHYPPLYFLVLAALSAVLGNEVLALKVSSIIVFAAIPITSYILMNVLFRDHGVALAAAWLMSLTPLAVEMLGWGGYPNLLGLALLPLAFAGVVLSIRRDEIKWVVIAAAACFLVGLTHVVVAVIFCFALVLLFCLRLVGHVWHRQWVLVVCCIAAALPIVTSEIINAEGQGYVTSNMMAAQRLQVQITSGIVMWLFRDPILFALMWTSAVMGGCLALWRGGRDTEVLLMISWFLSPLVLSQLSFLGIATDFQRIFFHVFQPFTTLAATPLLELSARKDHVLDSILELRPLEVVDRTLRSLGEALVRALPMILVAMTIVSLPLSSLVGIAALRNVDSWYNGVDPYGDREKADLLQYVVANTRTTDVFVAEDSMARWLEGYAQRRVVMHHPPMYLFLNGEIEREYVARAILLSTNGIRSRSAWVLDQFPYGRMCPLVQLYMKGDYDSVLYLDENTSYVTYADSETGHVYRLCFSNFTDRTGGIVNSPQGTFLIAKYQNDQVVLVRNATITSDGVEVQLAFTVRSMQADYKLVELAVNMCRCDERTFFEVWREPTNNSSEPSLRIVTDLGDFHIYSSSRTAFPFMFYPSSDGKVTGSLTMWSNETSSTDIDQVAYCSASLLRQWNISYVVIPMTGRVASPSNAEVRVMSIPLYDHLIRDPLFLVTYWNDRLILLSAKRI